MNDLNVSIIERWPYLEIIVNLPNGRVLRDKAVWHIAATQFAPKIQIAFEEAIRALIDRNKQQRGVTEPQKQ